jgi:hypothetical protein
MLEDIETREKKSQERRTAIAATAEKVIGDVTNFAFDNRKRRIDEELSSIATAKEFELRMAGDNEAKKAYINQKYDEKERQLKIKQAQAEKQRAIFEIILQTTINVVKASANPLLAGLAAGVGAVQLALAAATPLPKYNKGTDYVKLGNNPAGIDTVPAWLTEGEAVLPVDVNKKIRKMGVTNSEIPRLVLMGKLSEKFGLSLPVMSFVGDVNRKELKSEVYGLTKRDVKEAMQEALYASPRDRFLFDKKGFSHYVHKGGIEIKQNNADYGI